MIMVEVVIILQENGIKVCVCGVYSFGVLPMVMGAIQF